MHMDKVQSLTIEKGRHFDRVQGPKTKIQLPKDKNKVTISTSYNI